MARSALIENSWARRGGMDDRIEVFGSEGVTYANLHMGNALPTFSENGYGYAVEKAPTTKGGPIRCSKNSGTTARRRNWLILPAAPEEKKLPRVTGEDGLVVLHALYAGYASAGEGRKIAMPFQASAVKKPIDLWLNGVTRQRVAKSSSEVKE